MLSPDERRKFEAQSLHHWQAEQRKLRAATVLGGPDPGVTWVLTEDDKAFLRSLPYPIDPA